MQCLIEYEANWLNQTNKSLKSSKNEQAGVRAQTVHNIVANKNIPKCTKRMHSAK